MCTLLLDISSLKNAKKSFYRAFNSIFGKVGRIAYENVVIELLKAKCLPSLYYGLEACPINKSQIKSLDFLLNNAFRKIFLTKSYDIASECILFFRCSVSDAIYARKLQSTEIGLCKRFVTNTVDELATVHECIRVMTTCISS